MAGQTHIIGQHVFEVSYDLEDGAMRLQNNLARILEDRLMQVYEEELSRADRPDKHLRFGDLELVLPPIREDHLEEELVDAVRSALRSKLQTAMVEEELQSPEQLWEADPAQSKLDLLRHYLQTGTMPWWAPVLQVDSIEKLFVDLMRSQASGINRMIREVGKADHVRRRLVSRFSEETMQRLIAVLEPSNAALIIDYAVQLGKMHKREPVVQASAEAFRQAKWTLILRYLLVERGSQFNTRMFVQSTVSDLAAHYNLSYRELLQFLVGGINSMLLNLSAFPTIREVLVTLWNQELQSAKNYRESTADSAMAPEENAKPVGRKTLLEQRTQAQLEAERLQEDLLRLLDFFTKGSWDATAANTSVQRLGDALLQILKAIPATVRELFDARGKVQAFRQRLSRFLEPKVLDAIIQVLEPSGAPFIEQYLQKVNEVQRQQTLVKTNAGSFEADLYYFVLTYLFVDRGSAFNQREFARSILSQIGQRHGISYRELILELAGILAAVSQETKREKRSALEQLIAALAQEEEDILGSPKAGDSIQRTTKAEAQLQEDLKSESFDLLQWLLLEGELPWWAKKQKASVNQLIPYLQALDSERLLRMLKQIGGRKGVPQRLAKLKPEETRKRVLFLLAPEEAVFILRYGEQLQKAQLEKPLIQVGQKAFEEALWTFFFQYLLLDAGSFFNRKSFVAQALHNLSTSFKVRFESLLSLLEENLFRQGNTRKTELGMILMEIRAGYEEQHDLLQQELKQQAEQRRQNGAKNKASDSPDTFNYLAENRGEGDVKSGASSLGKALTNRELKKLRAKIRKNPGMAWKLVEALRQLLLSGQVPSWWKWDQSPVSVLKLALEELPSRSENMLGKALSQQAMRDVLERSDVLVNQGKLLRKIDDGYSRELLRLLDLWDAVLVQLKLDASWKKTLRNKLWLVAWTMVLNQRQNAVFKAATFFELWLAEVAQFAAGRKEVLSDLIQQLISKKQPMASVDGTVRTAWQMTVYNWLDEQGMERPALVPEADKKASVNATSEGEPKEPKEREKGPPFFPEQEPLGEPVFIPNAGLVLIHTYFPTLFDRSGLLEDGIFKDLEAAQRAVHLLHFLSTGREESEEEHLVLNKVLCGLPVREPIGADFQITEPEKELIEGMLQAVIGYWDAIGNSSLEGFRGAWMVREGKLEEWEENWELTVEQRSYDALMDSLPFSYTLVMHPWMNKHLTVSWR